MTGDAGLTVSVRVARRDFPLDIEIELEPGGRLALVGPSGAGKTSILRTVAGLIKPESGLIRIAGDTVFDSSNRVDVPPEVRRCGYVPQEYSLFPHMSALANVGFGMTGSTRAERRRRATGLLERLGIGALADVRPAELSGGELQRVALARALATEPAIFLLDEPLSALDPATREKVIPVLEEALARTRAPALIVTHSRHDAERLAESTMIIDRGRITETRKHGSGKRQDQGGSVSIHREIRTQRD